jgi:hypothetical protein
LFHHQELEDLKEEHGIWGDSPEEVCYQVIASNLQGWIIPENYPEDDGSDVFLASTSKLELQEVELL